MIYIITYYDVDGYLSCEEIVANSLIEAVHLFEENNSKQEEDVVSIICSK